MSAVLKDMSLTVEQKELVAQAINNYGDGQHPKAEGRALDFFQIPYVLHCLGRQYVYQKELGERHEAICDKVDALLQPNVASNATEFTKEQVMAIYDRWLIRGENERQMTFVGFISNARPVFGDDSAVTIPWCGMWLCIEKDGHTHS